MVSTFLADLVEGIDAQWAGQVALSVVVVLVMMVSCKSKANKCFERKKATWQRVDSVRARNNDELSVPQTESQLARYKSLGLLDTFRTYEEELKIAHEHARSQEKDVASVAAVVGAIFLYFFWRQVSSAVDKELGIADVMLLEIGAAAVLPFLASTSMWPLRLHAPTMERLTLFHATLSVVYMAMEDIGCLSRQFVLVNLIAHLLVASYHCAVASELAKKETCNNEKWMAAKHKAMDASHTSEPRCSSASVAQESGGRMPSTTPAE